MDRALLEIHRRIIQGSSSGKVKGLEVEVKLNGTNRMREGVMVGKDHGFVETMGDGVVDRDNGINATMVEVVVHLDSSGIRGMKGEGVKDSGITVSRAGEVGAEIGIKVTRGGDGGKL